MAKLLILKKDPVDGKDTHAVSGLLKSDPTKPYAGTGDYTYKGEVTEGLSDFVRIDGIPLAVVTSASKLRDDGKDAHAAKNGSNFIPDGPDTSLAVLFVPPTGVGDGKPGTAAGSTLVRVAGAKALLDGDKFDTCGVGTGTATVAAKKQSWVTSA